MPELNSDIANKTEITTNPQIEESTKSENKKIESETESTDVTELDQEIPDLWMVRDCAVYEDEYDECTSFRGRFQQYFVYGETLNCNQWKKDYDNCDKWTSKKDYKAVKTLIESEKSRRMERLKGHYNNTIWQKRDSPPADWNKPLPEWLVKRDENSYLSLKAKELNSQDNGNTEETKSSCCIM